VLGRVSFIIVIVNSYKELIIVFYEEGGSSPSQDSLRYIVIDYIE
jgi:hypothetical protein